MSQSEIIALVFKSYNRLKLLKCNAFHFLLFKRKLTNLTVFVGFFSTSLFSLHTSDHTLQLTSSKINSNVTDFVRNYVLQTAVG